MLETCFQESLRGLRQSIFICFNGLYKMTMFVLIFFKFDHMSGSQENAGAGWRLV